MSAVDTFLAEVISKHNTGTATEHSYRPAFEVLFGSLDHDITALNEPKRVKCGAPDFIFLRDGIAVGHLEAKNVDEDIHNLRGYSKEQQKRYLDALPNLIYSNGLDWDFFRDGELVESITIGSLDKTITADPRQFAKLESLLADFVVQTPLSITSPKELAQRMAGKARLIKAVFFNALADDLKNKIDTDLAFQFTTFQDNLIHDIEPEGFADMYAETICYGMFAARLHDDTLETFSRHEALDKLPKTNPFLKNLFSYVAGSGLDDRIAWIIDDLAGIFRATDVASIMAGFGKLTGKEDPFLHFYETFLSAYNPQKRKSRGVWYTPEAVVNFIVRAVDEILQTEFALPEGLADTSKVKIQWETGQTELTKAGKLRKDGRVATFEKEVHRVQILDPATGTGTFLAEVVKQIAPKVKGVAPGMWSGYVEDELIPRIHGFEILMASYAMCHMKLDMVLTELGYKPSASPPRQSVYLTNSLEEGDPPNYVLPFARWLANEVKLANTIKRDMPIMCVIGNPPYSGISQNKGDWITRLIEDYKYVDGKHFGERKHWLHDDYVKFIRLSEELINKNGEGVLGFITNHGYLDNPTFRGMRWHLLKTFDKIWILDLHGRRNQVVPDTGKADKNVFDIPLGVSIIVAVKKKDGGKGLAEVMHGDLWGDRSSKYKALGEYSLADGIFEKLEIMPPRYPFVRRNWSALKAYDDGFAINKFMPVNVTGIVSMGDKFAIAETAQELEANLADFLTTDYSEKELKEQYGLGKNYASWALSNKKELGHADLKPVPISYRPFDTRVTFFDNRVLWRWRHSVMRHMLAGKNIALVSCRQSAVNTWEHTFVSSGIVDDSYISNRTKERGYVLPLYLYPTEDDLHDTEPDVNFDPELYTRLQALATHIDLGKPNEVDVFDYIYGVLHCPVYRNTYADFLKSDFARIPWPASPDEFWNISTKGSALRKLHLMDPETVGAAPFSFEGDSNNIVGPIGKASYREGKVWINEFQYFADVPKVVWELYIGGYQPAQKWLKDRQGRALTFADVKHYQQIIKILAETDRIMGEISITLTTV